MKPEINSGWPLKRMETRSITPGVSILSSFDPSICMHTILYNNNYLRLTLEVFHDIQKLIVHVRTGRELDFDLIQVSQSVTNIEWSIIGAIIIRLRRLLLWWRWWCWRWLTSCCWLRSKTWATVTSICCS